MTTGLRGVNARATSGPGWMLLLVAGLLLLAVGATREGGPQTPGDRVDAISRRLACPVCDGESVFESRNPASDAIRTEIGAQVAEGLRSDDAIIEFLADRYGAQVLLVPRSTGIEALVWAVPVAALVCVAAALVAVFRRWSREARAIGGPTAADEALVAEALAAEERDEP